MTAVIACLMIFLFEVRAFSRLVRKYSEHEDFEVFVTRAPIEDVLRAWQHNQSAGLALMLATIMSIIHPR